MVCERCGGGSVLACGVCGGGTRASGSTCACTCARVHVCVCACSDLHRLEEVGGHGRGQQEAAKIAE